MKAFIESAVSISPQHTFGTGEFLSEPVEPENRWFFCSHPNYREFINPAALRRMSPVIRMGLCSAMRCLEEAGGNQPDAIIIGSGLGCIKDTVKFLKQMKENNEQLLNPTAFIQSTHNTVSGQIALQMGCRGYNLTFSQKSISFESALIDALMVLVQDQVPGILVGGLDEITEDSFELLVNAGCARPWIKGTTGSGKGFIAGEGAAFFMLGADVTERSLAVLDEVRVICQPGGAAGMRKEIDRFLSDHQLGPEGVDILMTGRNGDTREDAIYTALEEGFSQSVILGYKHLTGEYDTASAFGMFLASKVLHHQVIPGATRLNDIEKSQINRILLVNQCRGRDLSLILLSAIQS